MLKTCQATTRRHHIPAMFGAGAILILGLFLFSACAPATIDEEMQKEIQALKTEVAALKEKVEQLETEQQQIKAALQELQQPEEAPPLSPAPPSLEPPVPSLAPAPEALTVGELLKNKDRLVGARVTVKGDPGPVLMHKKILYLQAPEGMVEVFFGNLADKKQIERLSAQAIDQPLTVTGLLAAAPGTAKDPTRIQIVAESVDF
jgi:outer membrane murein-binding lipoprotein Lpp